MKNLILLTAFLSATLFSAAQITYEHTYNPPQVDIIKLEFAGFKYCYLDTAINLYNLDHSLYKQIRIPAQPNANSYSIQYITERLFDNDSSNLEYLLVGSTGTSGLFDVHYVNVYSETGTLLFSKDSVKLQYTSGFGTNLSTLPIRNTNEGAKMFLVEDGYPLSTPVRVYGLPGSLECSSCITQDGVNGLTNTNNDQGFLIAAPNPARNFTRIKYQLSSAEQKASIVIYTLQGQELKRYPVDQSSSYLTLSVTDLAAGTYFYSLEVEGKRPTAKQMVVIR